jgi:hypothetical protein
VVKRLYVLANQHDATNQITKPYRHDEAPGQQGFDASGIKQSQDLDIPSELYHHTSSSRNKPLPLITFVREDPNHPAKVCLFYPQ